MSVLSTVMRKLSRKILRAIVTLSYDSAGIQRVQITTLDGDVYEFPRIQQYGLTSNPQNDSEAICLMLNESNGVVIAVDDRRYRLKGLAKGEVALYDDEGSKLHLQRGGKILVKAPTQVTVDTPLTHYTGNITTDGSIDSVGDITSSGSMSAVGDITSDSSMSAVGDITSDSNILAAGKMLDMSESNSITVSDIRSGMSDIRTVYNNHDHAEEVGGPTSKML